MLMVIKSSIATLHIVLHLRTEVVKDTYLISSTLGKSEFIVKFKMSASEVSHDMSSNY